MRTGARFGVLLPIAMLVVATGAGAAYFGLHMAKDQILAVQSDESLRKTRLLAAQMNAWLEDRKHDARFWARIPTCRQCIDRESAPSECNAAGVVFSELVEEYPFLQSVNILSTEGEVVASNMPNKVGENYGDREYFKQAIHGKTYVSRLLISRFTHVPIFIISSPIRGTSETGENRVLAVLYAVVDLELFEQIFVRPNCNSDREIFIVDQEGAFVSCTDPRLVWNRQTLADSPYKELDASDGPAIQTIEINGEPCIVTKASTPITHWTIWSATKERSLLTGLTRLWWGSIGITAVVVFCAVLFLAALLKPPASDPHWEIDDATYKVPDTRNAGEPVDRDSIVSGVLLEQKPRRDA